MIGEKFYFDFDIVKVTKIDDIDSSVCEVSSQTKIGLTVFSWHLEDRLYRINNENTKIYDKLVLLYDTVKLLKFYNRNVDRIFLKYWHDSFQNPGNFEANYNHLNEVIDKLKQLEETQIDNVYIFK